MGCQFSKAKRQARVQHRSSLSAPREVMEKEKTIDPSTTSARKTIENEQEVDLDAILNDPHFMNPYEGVKTAIPEQISLPDLQVERTQSDEFVKSPPPPQPQPWEAMQQALLREETERRRQKEKVQRRKALKKAQLRRHRSVPEEDTLYELPLNARMPEVDYNSEEFSVTATSSGSAKVVI